MQEADTTARHLRVYWTSRPASSTPRAAEGTVFRSLTIRRFPVETEEGYSELYEDALRLAAVAHFDQKRKGSGLPYIIHPVQVSVILLRHGFPVEVAVAGLLHDVVEDQGHELTEIEGRFGTRVAEIVAALTERKMDAQGAKRPWSVRKQEGLRQMRRGSPQAVAVKAADALHNVRSFVSEVRERGGQVWRHFNGGPQAQIEYYRRVLEIAKERLQNHPLVDELVDAIDELVQVAEGEV